MSGPQVYLSWPTTFNLFAEALPHALPPPVKERTFRSPFGIDKDLFNFALRPEVPLIFATAYIIAVFSLNAYNRNRDWKPWWISRQSPFNWFVVLHNVILAAYSFATFAAMIRAIVHTWPEGGLTGNPNGAAGVADALCKLHGPRGLGDAATYNVTLNIWEVKNTVIHLGYDGNPDPTDVGRLWNEGLAFWGWIFYVSKFYEVLDTLIILAKGKRSATLQTYHHAGAMLCMWAGIRYMSPPIWMFVFINSGIHAMMYTYFTLSALGYRVPQALKRTLTSLQIAQFVFGASYAAAHLFVQYDIPVSTPYEVASIVRRAVSSASHAAASATSAVSSVSSEVSKVVAAPTATGSIGAIIKKLLLRAAGEEGLAERVHDKTTGELTTPHMEEKIEQFNEETLYETKWRTEWTKVNCIDTSGEAFAIYLNLLYLAPLTFLFARFFLRAYTQRGKPRSVKQAARRISESAKQAEKQTEKAFEHQGEKLEDELAEKGPEAAERAGEKVKAGAEDLHEQLRDDVRKMKEGKFRGDRRVSDRVASFERQVKTKTEKVVEKGKGLLSGENNASGSGSRNSSPQKGSRSRQSSPQKGSRIPVKKGSESAVEDEPQRRPEQEPKEEGLLGSGAHNESEGKQDENMAQSQAVRDPDDAPAGGARDESVSASGEGKENQPPLGHGANNESEEKQEANMDDSQAIRPGDSIEPAQSGEGTGGEEDTDAMGKSGSIIDLTKEKAKDAKQSAEEEKEAKEEDPTMPQSMPAS